MMYLNDHNVYILKLRFKESLHLSVVMNQTKQFRIIAKLLKSFAKNKSRQYEKSCCNCSSNSATTFAGHHCVNCVMRYLNLD